jgi:chemotaxis signal transduction protein
MSAASPSLQSFVVFPLGAKRFAVDAGVVRELWRPGRVQEFPHQTPGLAGVVLHRGLVLPVWDIAQSVHGASASPCKLYLVVQRNVHGFKECAAVQVSGECQLIHAEMQPAASGQPRYVRGVLQLDFELVEVLDLSKLGAAPRKVDSVASQPIAGEDIT